MMINFNEILDDRKPKFGSRTYGKKGDHHLKVGKADYALNKYKIPKGLISESGKKGSVKGTYSNMKFFEQRRNPKIKNKQNAKHGYKFNEFTPPEKPHKMRLTLKISEKLKHEQNSLTKTSYISKSDAGEINIIRN